MTSTPSRLWQCWSVRVLFHIGEAANNIMQLALDIEQLNPTLWLHLRGDYGIRNKLTHGYRSVNDLIVWNTAADYLPELRMHIAAEQLRDVRGMS